MTYEFVETQIRKLFTGTLIVTIGLFFNGLFSYLLQVFLGRNLSVEDFGTFNALLSLFYLFSVPVGVLGTSIIKSVSELLGQKKYDTLTSLYWNLSIYLFILGLIVMLILTGFREVFANYFNIDNSSYFFFLGLYVMSNFLVVVAQSYLQGLLRFKAFAFYATLAGLLRLIIPATILVLGYSLGGIYFGLAVSLIICYLISTLLLTRNFTSSKDSNLSSIYRKILTFSLPVLVVNLGLLFITNIDVLMVKKYFSSDLAGYYSGVMTIGKIVLFGAGSISIVMFPEISALKSANKSYKDKFKFFFILQAVVVGVATYLFISFPRLITNMFFGQQFAYSIEYLPRFIVFITLYVLANFLVMYFLAIERTKVYYVMFLPVILQFVLLNLYHDSLYTVININILISAILLVTLLIYLYKINRE